MNKEPKRNGSDEILKIWDRTSTLIVLLVVVTLLAVGITLKCVETPDTIIPEEIFE